MKKYRLFSLFIVFDVFLLISSLFVNNKTSSLYGKVIVVDPGHGGNDNGAEVDDVLEDEVNLSIAKILYQKLFDQGVVVHLTRTSDYDLAPDNAQNRKNKDLKRRTQFINEVDADLFISIHLNIYETSNVNGIQVFYQGYKDDSKKLANLIQKEFNKNINKKNKKVKLGDYYILNYTYPIGVLVECGFLSNYDERKNLVDTKYQEKIANNILNGIKKYYL